MHKMGWKQVKSSLPFKHKSLSRKIEYEKVHFTK